MRSMNNIFGGIDFSHFPKIKCRCLLENGGCDLGPKNGCEHTTNDGRCNFRDSTKLGIASDKEDKINKVDS